MEILSKRITQTMAKEILKVGDRKNENNIKNEYIHLQMQTAGKIYKKPSEKNMASS